MEIRKNAMKEARASIRMAFANRVITNDTILIVHSDTKAPTDIIGGNIARSEEAVERQVVTVTDVDNLRVDQFKEQFIVVPGFKDGIGRAACDRANGSLERM
jgi:hypothetical protein